MTAAGHVWRLVGGALAYVPSWTVYGGRKPTVALTARQLAEVLTTHVADGEFIHTIQDGAVYRIADGVPMYVSSWAAIGGRHSSIGVDEQNIRKSDTYPWQAFRQLPWMDRGSYDPGHNVGPARDRPVFHFVRTWADGRVYELVGGAPLYVTSWARFGGPQPTVTIDRAVVEHAGPCELSGSCTGRWRFLDWYPDPVGEGVVVDAAARPGAPPVYYIVVNHAPVYVPDITKIWGPTYHPLAYPVDPVTLARAGTGGPFNHLLTAAN